MSDDADAPVTPEDDAIDMRVLDDIRAIDDGLVGEVVHLYKDDAPQRIEAMRAAINSGEALALARAAHGLKSSSGNVGATHVTRLCADIEQMGRSGQVAGADAKLEALEREYARATKVLDEQAAR